MSADFLTYLERQRQRLLGQRKKIDDQLQQLAAAEKLYRAAEAKGVVQRVVAELQTGGSSKTELKTIKDRIREIIVAKSDGMTSNEILERLQRDSPSLTRTSLSPQLSRLKADGVLVRDDTTGRWQLAQGDLPTSSADDDWEEFLR